ncbi:hypothetical protein GOP47_0003672 [Adiantum capillus-veneris]|uniref:non-specific serine/threonine protein kinase n=1 Tax=Adiantum capillus-veneris TaxID=13818 RepID=A0A9D4V650_ADICA|nr:hypothetical protein GOP47_0003672 [Adiantum capillus-veneris]
MAIRALGSMSSAAAAYGGNGPAFCGLRSSAGSGSGGVECFGSDAASVYGAPLRLGLLGLTAGDGFVCGLTVFSHLPYCWGNNVYVQQGTPTSKGPNITYSEICAGDNHLCALRSASPQVEVQQAVDCWGYNITGSFAEGASLTSITAGSLFSCGLFAANRTPICWGDETGSRVISGAPQQAKFVSLSAGGYHVCGILESSGATLCWGRELEGQNGLPGSARFTSLVGGRFHACGLLASQQTVSCWGLINPPNSIPPPTTSRFSAMVAGDYYTCGIPSSSLQPLCWGAQFPAVLPTGALPPVDCMLCGNNCPAVCTPSTHHTNSVQTPIIIGELATAVVVVACVLATAIFLVRYKLAKLAAATANGSMSGSIKKQRGVSGNKKGSFGSSFMKERLTSTELEEPKMSRAEVFSHQELEQATGGFDKGNEVGKGSFSIVYRGVLGDGRVVAVKRAAAVPLPSQQQKDSNEFRNELDLLSRLNHAHLLTLLGFCDDREERLLVYEFMANGTLHEQLHGNNRQQIGWVRRVTVAVQAARGLEYLHGYACPPVIHRDIKSSNILLDDEWNARVSDFGLSLLGPMDSDSPLSELPAGTLGYLDPEYYRLHYLTTKSDVYSFGVLLLEIMSGRKAIDMEYDEGNIVEWAVPLIKEGQVQCVLDPRLEAPPNLDAVHKIARVAARCVKMRGKDRPSMDKVTTSLERALAMLMGTYSEAQPFLPSEVVLGSNRLHRKSSQKSSCRSTFDVDSLETTEEHEDHRNPSSLTFPSINSSLRRGSLSDNDMGGSVDIALPDHDVEARQQRQQLMFQYCKSEIYPASPQQLFLSSNF